MQMHGNYSQSQILRAKLVSSRGALTLLAHPCSLFCKQNTKAKNNGNMLAFYNLSQYVIYPALVNNNVTAIIHVML